MKDQFEKKNAYIINMADSKIACMKCKSSVEKLNILVCEHKLCDVCTFRSKNKKLITCPIEQCKKISDRAPKIEINGRRLTLQEEAIQKSLRQFCDDETLALIDRYRNDLGRRTRECDVAMTNLIKAKAELKQDEKKHSDELEQTYERRISELQTHFEGMTKRVKTNFQQRLQNLEEAIEDVEKVLSDVKTSIADIEQIILLLTKSRDTSLTQEKMRDIRRKTIESEKQTIQLEQIQGVIVKVKTDESLEIKDSIDITPPEPIGIHKTQEVRLNLYIHS